jgi:DNA-binding MarR family transcriptional regulator
MGQAAALERVLSSAGVRVDRAGAALLYVLHEQRDPVRVTGLAELLGTRSATVTRKVQQLEKAGLVARHGDPQDGRVTRISLTVVGRRTLERVLKARHAWFDGLLAEWGEDELVVFAASLERFAAALERDMEQLRAS